MIRFNGYGSRSEQRGGNKKNMDPISQTNRRIEDLLCGINGDPIAILKGADSTAIRSVDLT